MKLEWEFRILPQNHTKSKNCILLCCCPVSKSSSSKKVSVYSKFQLNFQFITNLTFISFFKYSNICFNECSHFWDFFSHFFSIQQFSNVFLAKMTKKRFFWTYTQLQMQFIRSINCWILWNKTVLNQISQRIRSFKNVGSFVNLQCLNFFGL